MTNWWANFRCCIVAHVPYGAGDWRGRSLHRGALMEGLVQVPSSTKVVCILSGGNLDVEKLQGMDWNWSVFLLSIITKFKLGLKALEHFCFAKPFYHIQIIIINNAVLLLFQHISRADSILFFEGFYFLLRSFNAILNNTLLACKSSLQFRFDGVGLIRFNGDFRHEWARRLILSAIMI